MDAEYLIGKFINILNRLRDEKLFKDNPSKALKVVRDGLSLLTDIGVLGLIETFKPSELKEFYYRSGVVFFNYGNLAEAEKLFKKALGLKSIEKYNFESYYYLGLIYLERGDFSAADSALQKMREIYRQETKDLKRRCVQYFETHLRFKQQMLEELNRHLNRKRLKGERLLLIEPSMKVYTTAAEALTYPEGDFIDLVTGKYRIKNKTGKFFDMQIARRRALLLLSLPPFGLVNEELLKKVYDSFDVTLKSQDLRRLPSAFGVDIDRKTHEVISLPGTLIIPCRFEIHPNPKVYQPTPVEIDLCQNLKS